MVFMILRSQMGNMLYIVMVLLASFTACSMMPGMKYFSLLKKDLEVDGLKTAQKQLGCGE